MIAGLPRGAFLRSTLLRTALVWAFVRATVAGASAGLAAAGLDADVGPASAIPVLLVVVAVVVGDQYRRGEVPFLRNLGVGPVGMLLPAIGLGVALELLLLAPRAF